jgi:hypothetical protein
MQFGAILFRWLAMGPAVAEIDGGASRNISFASILGSQLSGSGIAFLILAAVIGVAGDGRRCKGRLLWLCRTSLANRFSAGA